MKKVLLLGASGNISPHIIPGLEQYYELRLADIRPHPGSKPTMAVDMGVYEQVLEAARGMDAIMNWTVVRDHPVQSFAVSTLGAYHVMKAAKELGIGKVLHTGPELIINHHLHDHDIGDVPQTPGTGYYFTTKHLAMEICKIYARAYGIQTVCFQFNGLRAQPEAPETAQDFPPFTITFDDLIEACRLAIEIESVPDDFQAFNLHSYLSQNKYSIDKAQRMLGFEPKKNVETLYRRIS